jgi:hypothetical protein
MYDQFLLDQPSQEQYKLRQDMYLRDELVRAMHAVCGGGSTRLKARDGSSRRRIGRRDFAACLVSMGGRFKRRRGARYWVNVGMTRRPLFAWDVI